MLVFSSSQTHECKRRCKYARQSRCPIVTPHFIYLSLITNIMFPSKIMRPFPKRTLWTCVCECVCVFEFTREDDTKQDETIPDCVQPGYPSALLSPPPSPPSHPWITSPVSPTDAASRVFVFSASAAISSSAAGDITCEEKIKAVRWKYQIGWISGGREGFLLLLTQTTVDPLRGENPLRSRKTELKWLIEKRPLKVHWGGFWVFGPV